LAVVAYWLAVTIARYLAKYSEADVCKMEAQIQVVRLAFEDLLSFRDTTVKQLVRLVVNCTLVVDHHLVLHPYLHPFLHQEAYRRWHRMLLALAHILGLS